jgi:hypothetical protein
MLSRWILGRGKLGMRRLVSVALGSLCLFTLASAQDIPKDVKLPSETRYLNSPSAGQYPESNALFLSDDVRFKVNPDGTTEYLEHDVIKVFTPSGVEDHKDLLRMYRSDLEEVEVQVARTILPDGRVLDVPKQAIADEPVFEPGESKVNQKMRRLVVRYPGVTPNSIVEFKIRTKKKPYAGNKWWAVSYVQNPEPMIESRFTLEVPTGTSWRYATPGYPGLAPEKSVLDGYERATWTITQSPPLAQEAVGPAVLTQMKRLEVSNFDDWNQLRAWFEQGFEASCEVDGAVLSQVKKLVKAESPASEQLQEIGTWANKKRFLSGALDDFRPNKAGALVDESVMNPVDSAVLLASLYRAAGFTATPVLAFELPPEVMSGELPRLNRVDTLLLVVKKGNQTWWVDPRHPLEFDANPPSGYQGGSALLADRQQPFERLSTSPADSNRVVTQVEARLDDKGKLELRFNTVEHGASATAYREASRELMESGKDQRDQQLARLFDRIASGYGSRARVLDRYFNLNARQGQPIDFAATVAVPDYTVKVGNKTAMVLPVRLNPQMVGLAEGQQPRTQPVRLEHPWREECRLRLLLPANAEVSELPPTVQIQSPFGSFFATTRSQGKEVYYYSRLVMNEAWVPRDKTAELAQFARQVVQARGKLLFTQPAKSAPTAH